MTVTVDPAPPGPTEALTITRFEFRADKNEWRIGGTSTIPGPGNTMTLFVGPTVAGSPVLGTAAVSNLGIWEFRERDSSVNPHSSGTISIQSSQGGTWEGISGVGPAASSILKSIKRPTSSPAARFLRGDCNHDGGVDISDAVCMVNWLFLGEAGSGCVAATNVDGVGAVNITDPIYLLTHLFLGGPPPVDPFPDCGTSDLETDRELGCETPQRNCVQ